jgi:hypothetical protein
VLNKFFLPAIVFATTWWTAGPDAAQAGHDSPIYCAAERYREAVRDFERHVLRTPRIAHCDERLVDDLEDSTSRLRSAARDPHRLDRLFERFHETEALHHRVEALFFLQGVYPPNPALADCWRPVAYAFAALVEQIRCLGGQCHVAARPRGAAIGPPASFRPSPRAGLPPGVGAPGFGAAGFGAPGFGAAGRFPGNAHRGPDWSRHGDVDRFRQPGRVHPGFPGRATLQRDARDVPFGRRDISTPQQLRSAILGALLQRL